MWASHTRECGASIIADPGSHAPIAYATFSPNYQFVLVSTLNSHMQLFSYCSTDKDGRPGRVALKKTYVGHKNEQYTVQTAFLVGDPSNRRFVVTGSEDHHAYLYDLNSRAVVGLLRGRRSESSPGTGHCDVVQGVAVHDAIIATSAGSKDRTVKIWRYQEPA